MTAMMTYYRTPVLPWSITEDDEVRFRRIAKRTAIIFLILALLMPFLPLPEIERERIEEVPPRLAKLLLERQEPPPPPVAAPQPEAVKKPEPKKEPPKPVEKKRIEAARAKAERSGLLAFKNELVALRSDTVTETLQRDRPLVRGSERSARAPDRSLITSQATASSGGVNTASLSRDTGGKGLAGRATTQVESPVDVSGSGRVQRGASGRVSRSIEDIKLIFDKNKGSIYTIYNRALRIDPSLQGKVVLKLTIAPSGAVVDCTIVSSELKSPELERKLVARIKQFDFGAKDVDTMVVTYPIDFLPS